MARVSHLRYIRELSSAGTLPRTLTLRAVRPAERLPWNLSSLRDSGQRSRSAAIKIAGLGTPRGTDMDMANSKANPMSRRAERTALPMNSSMAPFPMGCTSGTSATTRHVATPATYCPAPTPTTCATRPSAVGEMVLRGGIEPTTSSLPMRCSTTELPQHREFSGSLAPKTPSQKTLNSLTLLANSVGRALLYQGRGLGCNRCFHWRNFRATVQQRAV